MNIWFMINLSTKQVFSRKAPLECYFPLWLHEGDGIRIGVMKYTVEILGA